MLYTRRGSRGHKKYSLPVTCLKGLGPEDRLGKTAAIAFASQTAHKFRTTQIKKNQNANEPSLLGIFPLAHLSSQHVGHKTILVEGEEIYNPAGHMVVGTAHQQRPIRHALPEHGVSLQRLDMVAANALRYPKTSQSCRCEKSHKVAASGLGPTAFQ